MKCPNCGTSMKLIPSSGSREEYSCAGCGMTKKKDSISLDPMKTELAPLPKLDKSKQASLSQPENKSSEESDNKTQGHLDKAKQVLLSQPERRTATGLKAQSQLDKARRTTEIRRAVKEISGKLNDLEIQFDRRVEELQMLIVKLTKNLDLTDD